MKLLFIIVQHFLTLLNNRMKKIFFLSIFLYASLTLSAQKPYASFSHIGLEVHNLDISTAFYTSLFHLDTMPNPFHGRRIKWFKLGGLTQFHLVEDTTTYVSQENFHIAFSVASISQFILVLKSKNIVYLDDNDKPYSITTRPDGVRQIYFNDPDGHLLEVNDAPY